MLTPSTTIVRETLDLDDRNAQALLRSLFDLSGITVGGSAPHDVQVHDDRFYARAVRDGTLGFGESYVEGWWDCEAVDQMFTRMALANLRDHIKQSWKRLATVIKARVFNLQNITRAFDIGRHHYDIGNDLYQAMLGPSMAYTCAYWRDADNLSDAQDAKLDLVCRKLGLDKGMRVLELGCGWGSFAKFAAQRYGASVTGFTVSREQVALGMERCKGLPVELSLQDYRKATGCYDRVVSIGIMEHVGPKNYRTYMEVADRCLAPQGIAFVHTIGGNLTRKTIDPWVEKYIFPNAVLPSLAQLGESFESIFVLEDLHNIGPDYDHTLMAWHANFERAWPALSSSNRGYDEQFYRMWRYYLLMSAASVRARDAQLYQLVLTRTGTAQPDCRKL